MEIKELGVDKNIVTKEYIFDGTDIKTAERRTLNELNRKYTVEGFRKGKVPLSVFKMRFGKDFYDYFVFEQLLEEVYKSFKEETNLLLIPEIVEKEINSENGRVVVNLHKKPVAKVEVEKIKVRIANKEQVLDNYLDLRLNSLKEEHAVLEPKEGPAEFDDLVRVKVFVVNKETGKVLIDGKEDEYVLYKEDERPTVKNVVGHKKGDVVEFDREFAGKEGESVTYQYNLEILEVYKRNLPELTDEFVKNNLSELHLETLEELKNKIREEGTKIYDDEIKHSIREQILAQLPDVTELFISEKTIDYAVRLIVNNMKEENKYEDYVKKYETEEKALESLKDYYVTELKKESAIEKLAKEYNIERKVSDEELEKYAEILAPYWGISVERAKVLAKEKPEIREEIENMIFVDKVIDKAAEKVQREIVDVNKEGEESEENN
ncbi:MULTISPECIES: trigger factor [unclassified Thermosipho (in: thermotogales)]|uniref:trigger factor n=1 Tax=unclassified Thermosipho (in: thermotogales) TaxID=2676525 RepID=UPI000986AA31|nr:MULTISPECIES: trigger factor [unclassified Thermosipho (in: thermotogales)]MBT1248048.1 trigger factor [Thermosipho sp. 1244]OOC46642.1 trigger factor [Thermosipho sp. 1223]